MPGNVGKKARHDGKRSRGLQTEINPLLLSSNLNLIKQQYRDENPYLSTSYLGPNDKVTKRLERGLKFYEKGEVSSEIEREREQQRLELERQVEQDRLSKIRREKEQAENSAKIARGELPDTRLGEEKYVRRPQDVPASEWWDQPYLDGQLNVLAKYQDGYEDESESDDDEELQAPSINYVHHPVPIEVSSVKPMTKVYLTNKEQKKIRRNRRKLEREEKDTRIRLGLEPKPEPKVKLANMMSVCENDQNITDPTQWEHTVIEQVEQRKKAHLEVNAKRHEEAVKSRKERKPEVSKDNCCKVFRFKSLASPKIRYKLSMNSKQLGLRGACLRIGDDGEGIIIAVGSEKSCKFFERLLLERIKWDEPFRDRTSGAIVEQPHNHVSKAWQGYLEADKFPRWFMKVCSDELELKDTLRQFDAEHFLSDVSHT